MEMLYKKMMDKLDHDSREGLIDEVVLDIGKLL